MKKSGLTTFCILLFGILTVSGQKKQRKNSFFAKFQLSGFPQWKSAEFPEPIYPVEAKTAGIAGKVEVIVEIDENGNVLEIESANGDDVFIQSAADAAKEAKFSPTTCDGKATKTIGVINFNFPAISLFSEFFRPIRIDEFPDIDEKNNYFEAILFLTENYKIAFGYLDRKFHPEMPLRKADFAEYLYQTLKMLDEKALFAKRFPADIELYRPYNPYSLTEIEFNPTAPESESVKKLSQKYGIILADESGIFDGETLYDNAEIISIWRDIFGEEAIPVNFSKTSSDEMTRGRFSLFLKESLDVLTYKILP